MTGEQAHDYYGKDISVILNDGIEVRGFCCVFIPYYDNDPEVDEMVLETSRGMVSVPVPDIDHIDIIG